MSKVNPYDLGSIARDDARRRNDPNGWALSALSDRLAALERRVRILEDERKNAPEEDEELSD